MRAGKRRSVSSRLLVAAVIAIIAATVMAPSMALATGNTSGAAVADKGTAASATGRGTGAPDGMTPPEGFDPSMMPQGGRGGAPGGMASPWLMTAGVALISGAVFFVIGLLVGRKIGLKSADSSPRAFEPIPVATREEMLEAPAVVTEGFEGGDD